MVKSLKKLKQQQVGDYVSSFKQTLFLLLLFFTISCKESRNPCEHKSKGQDNKIVKTIGCLSDSMEIGNWEKYGENGEIKEKGYYDNGIKSGEWFYFLNNIKINWQKFEYDSYKIRTNVPMLISNIEKFNFYTKFNSSDTSKFLTLTIGVNNPNIKSINIDSYYKEIEQSIKNEGYQFKSEKIKFQCDGRYFYFIKNTALNKDNNLGVIDILNFYGFDVNNNFIEITCIGKNSSSKYVNIILSDVASNLFINNIRFIHPLKTMSPMILE
jgi:hypothetical protein